MTDNYVERQHESRVPTPYAVYCLRCEPDMGLVYLTDEEYSAQLGTPASVWMCPRCGGSAEWSDENYERANTE